MKADKIEICGLCGHYVLDFSLERILTTGMCLKLGKPAIADKLLPDCPLPDWPSMTAEQVSAMFDHAVGIIGEGRGTRFIIDCLRAMGMEIEEEKT